MLPLYINSPLRYEFSNSPLEENKVSNLELFSSISFDMHKKDWSKYNINFWNWSLTSILDPHNGSKWNTLCKLLKSTLNLIFELSIVSIGSSQLNSELVE